ncbi:hypothetical protein DKT77_02510 [Meridianimarinicoccus roseus]|jgi:invasion protein IalB|uniref:Invasion associated locus B family protein n=1 Tax=Meridianimarinicoccus roseus TaxID=2072018 RepID=A0A2V2LEZ8_9RHOB|nr:invasion associated locus B family protein [Meridianimarinicoccus roseus]PWR04188.1 hypothetical protein DKT77_02510 [Meridianimarinicoccus roseus]
MGKTCNSPRGRLGGAYRAVRRITAASVLIVAGAAGAQQAQLAPGDWGVRCEAQGCLVVTSVADEQSNRMLSLTLALPRTEGPVRFAVLTPLGTALDKGLHLRAGVLDQTYPFATCTPEGCAVLLDLPQPDVVQLAAQPQLRATFYAVNRREPYEVNVNLEEMGAALDAAMTELAR